MGSIMMFMNEDSFYSSFPILIFFIYFSCLITLSRNSSIIWNRSGDSIHLCFVSDFRVKHLIFNS